MPTAIVDQRQSVPAPDRLRPACREAVSITGRPYVSHSQLSTMRQCPRRFSFQYIERARLDFQPSSLLFGGAMHAAFESWYRGRLEGITATPADLFDAFMDRWKLDRAGVGGDVPVKFCKGEDMGTITALARRMIDAFLAAPISRPNGRILGIEEQFSVVLAPDLPDIVARVDLVTETAEALHVVDLKTARSRWTEERAAEAGEQLLLYGRVTRDLARGAGLPTKLHFAVITKAKVPQVQVIDVLADQGRLSAVRDSVAQVWTAARGGNYFANPSPLNCSNCPFKSRCPAFAG